MRYFLLMLFLIPSFVWGYFDLETCHKHRKEALSYWKESEKLIESIQAMSLEQKEQSLPLFHQAINHTHKAYDIYKKILRDIAKQKEHKIKKEWHKSMQQACEADKNVSFQKLQELKNELCNREWVIHAETLFAAKNRELQQFLEATKELYQKIASIEEEERLPLLLQAAISMAKITSSYLDLIERASNIGNEAFRSSVLKGPIEEAVNALAGHQKEEKELEEAIIKTKVFILHRESLVKASLAKTKEVAVSRRLKDEVALPLALGEVIKLYEEAFSLVKEALTLITPTNLIEEENTVKALFVEITELLQQYKNELASHVQNNLSHKDAVKKQVALLEKESLLLKSKGFMRSSLEINQKIEPLLSQLPGCEESLYKLKEEIASLQSFLSKADVVEEVKKQKNLPFVMPFLDQYTGTHFLYAGEFHRVNLKRVSPASYLTIKIQDGDRVIHEEKVIIPCKHTLAWDRYLLQEGKVHIPEMQAQQKFGLDLHFQLVEDPHYASFLVLDVQGSVSPYRYSIFLEDTLFYTYSFINPPPWQLDALRRPNRLHSDKGVQEPALFTASFLVDKGSKDLEIPAVPILDLFVQEMKNDPLLLAQYVQNEINLTHYFRQSLEAPSIHKGVLRTFLEKEGSAWELCRLLVYLLRQAGYSALYAEGSSCILSKAFAERMLFADIENGKEEVELKYPWVLLQKEGEWISLFPWMKEIQVEEGFSLYSLMPENYVSADRFIHEYLKGDEAILKHVGPDGDDCAGTLFIKVIAEELRKKGLSLQDVGIHRVPIKKQFCSFADFPRPTLQGDFHAFATLQNKENLFAKIRVEIFSKENREKGFFEEFLLADLDCRAFGIRFSAEGDSHRLHLSLEDKLKGSFLVNQTELLVEVKVSYATFIEGKPFRQTQSLFLSKGSSAALCFHLGGTESTISSLFGKQIEKQTEEENRVQALLAFTGAAYFEKCSYSELLLAYLHKTSPKTIFSFGLAKISPDLLAVPVQGTPILRFPGVDMFHFSSQNQDPALSGLICADRSSKEHRILEEVFEDPYAISTVRLLQLAHKNRREKSFAAPGFLELTSQIMEAADQDPRRAGFLYFPHLGDVRLRSIQKDPSGQWQFVKNILSQSDYAYAYMISSPLFDGEYTSIGSFVIHPDMYYSLLSQGFQITHGGLSSKLPDGYLTSLKINSWDTQKLPVPPSIQGVTIKGPEKKIEPMFSIEPLAVSLYSKVKPDVREQHKSKWDCVADPVDVISGAFYIDEVDMLLPRSFSLAIRRNYSSQNLLNGFLGYGWKLNLNPFLLEEGDNLFAAEEDGTVIAYRFNPNSSRWEVFPEDNPHLHNLSAEGPSTCNPLHNTIENDVLYGADGSKRFFEENLLKKWVSATGNTLVFSYEASRLVKIESFVKDITETSFCKISYNPEGRISEIFAGDGKSVRYLYSSRGDLQEVILPNGAHITYEYDSSHRILRETKPCGATLENIYDSEGRIAQQRSPILYQGYMGKSAAFSYEDASRSVTDACGATTTYKIFDGKIYKIIDPLGVETLQSWFITKNTWFDAREEVLKEFIGDGGWANSLKSSQDKRGLVTNYLYDTKGNVSTIFIEDDNGPLCKKLTYNENNLCVKEETSNRKVITTYDATLPALPQRVEYTCNDVVTFFVDFVYNTRGQITEENRAGSLVLYEYDRGGFLYRKIEKTGTNDPDLVTAFSYNREGQCVEKITVDSIQKATYDTTGNRVSFLVYSKKGELLTESYTKYNLNNQPILSYGADVEDLLYLDYNPMGKIKASRHGHAYTLYEYNKSGLLEEEIDPLGVATCYEYDSLGRTTKKSIEGHGPLFTYEKGGLLATITSPSLAKTRRGYTKAGLLKEEIYPDDTKISFSYDFLGRPIQKEENGLVTTFLYDDETHTVTKTLQEKVEVSQFDARGNLLTFTDALGNIWEKSYDALDRLISERAPSGEETTWSYQGDMVICFLPNKEIEITRYEMGRAVDCRTYNPKDDLIEHVTFSYDESTKMEKVTRGDVSEIIRKNALGQPLEVQIGGLLSSYQYDLKGNCISYQDGEGHVTLQRFDVFGRLIEKTLPDGALITYIYDADSNLIECHMPNDLIWKASYDLMGRKIFEELRAGELSSQRFIYRYNGGLLEEVIDPLDRSHRYFYDSYHRLIEEHVDGYIRLYTYDLLDRITSIEETSEDTSLVIRDYDSSGRLITESIYLNSQLLQKTEQTWQEGYRALKIGNHKREFFCQGEQIQKIVCQELELFYEYALDGSLTQKKGPFTQVDIAYKESLIPKNIKTRLLDKTYTEVLDWSPAGKLNGLEGENTFTYTSRGFLHSSKEGSYEFDFGAPGLGVRTKAPECIVPLDGLDPFGKALQEIVPNSHFETLYDAMGQVLCQGDKSYSWDPWGRLLSVTTDTYSWRASYDGLGRRIRTYYTPAQEEEVEVTFFYDPEDEFLEIGSQHKEKIFWKIYGPSSCDAVIDSEGSFLLLSQNALGALTAAISSKEIFPSLEEPSLYGPTKIFSSSIEDLLTYALSFTWHSKSLDPTGLIWMGARYYDPISGRFLSPDPIGYPICLDLYNYANGDPVNYKDPDGRFASHAYQVTKSKIVDVFQDPRTAGYIQAGFGLAETLAGKALFATPPTAILGGFMVVDGLDRYAAGMLSVFSEKPVDTAKMQLLVAAGLSHNSAFFIDECLSSTLQLGGSHFSKQGIAYASKFSGTATLTAAEIPTFEKAAFKSFKAHNYRYNLKVLTGLNPGRSIHAHHVFPQTYEKYFLRAGMNIHDPKYLSWWRASPHLENAKNYNFDWAIFKQAYPNAPADQILKEGRRLMSEHGITINF